MTEYNIPTQFTIQNTGYVINDSTSVHSDFWQSIKPAKTTEQIVEEKVKQMLADQNMVLVPKAKYEEITQTILKLNEGYCELYRFLTGKEAKSLPDVLEGLTEVIKERSLDEVLIEKAKQKAKEELGEVAERI